MSIFSRIFTLVTVSSLLDIYLLLNFIVVFPKFFPYAILFFISAISLFDIIHSKSSTYASLGSISIFIPTPFSLFILSVST